MSTIDQSISCHNSSSSSISTSCRLDACPSGASGTWLSCFIIHSRTRRCARTLANRCYVQAVTDRQAERTWRDQSSGPAVFPSGSPWTMQRRLRKGIFVTYARGEKSAANTYLDPSQISCPSQPGRVPEFGLAIYVCLVPTQGLKEPVRGRPQYLRPRC